MSAPPSFSPSLPAAGDAPASDVAHYLDVLQHLAELGVGLAQAIHDQAGDDAAAAAEPFDRVTRSVRRCILLAQKLQEPAAATPAQTLAVLRRKVLRSVEDSIDAVVLAEAAPRVRAELLDRLDSPDLDDDLAVRPIGEVIAEIRRDLGINVDAAVYTPGVRRTPDDVAALGRAAKRRAAPRGASQREDGAMLLHRAMRFRSP